MSDRDTILTRIARNVLAGGPPPGGLDHLVQAETAAVPEADTETLVASFTRELEALAGRVARVPDVPSAADAVLRQARAAGSRRVLSWNADQFDPPGLLELVSASVVIERCDLPADPAARLARLKEIDDITVGLTGASAGLAATGSVVLTSGPGRGRIASLMPLVHVCVLRLQRLVPTLQHFLEAHPRLADEGSNTVVITGPSRTADIEMTLTRGVHGPKEVHVILVG